MNLFATGRETIGQALASARGDLVIRCMAEPPGGQMSPLPSLRAKSFRARARHPGAIDRIGVCSLRPANPLLRGRNQDGGERKRGGWTVNGNPTVSCPPAVHIGPKCVVRFRVNVSVGQVIPA